MFETTVGPVKDSGSVAYLRPETAQGIFINFKNVLQFARKKPPFGIAQVGKSFRNEITPGNFIFRTREFEQMEMEFFVPPAEAEQWYALLDRDARALVHATSASGPTTCWLRPHESDELSHYSSGTSDIEYLFPIGWSELEGIANRGDFDLSAARRALAARSSSTSTRAPASATSRTSSSRPPAPTARRSPSSSTPTTRRRSAGEQRTVLQLHPRLSPVKVAVLPLVRKDGQPELAREVHAALAPLMQAEYDEGGVDRQALPPPGRDRHAVVRDDRPRVARGPHGHRARPRLADAGPGGDRRASRAAGRAARAAVDEPEARDRLTGPVRRRARP